MKVPDSLWNLDYVAVFLNCILLLNFCKYDSIQQTAKCPIFKIDWNIFSKFSFM